MSQATSAKIAIPNHNDEISNLGESVENNNVTIVHDNYQQNIDANFPADILDRNLFDSAQNEKLHQPPTAYASVDLIYSENFHKLSKEILKNTDCKIQLKVLKFSNAYCK